ncbi:DUF1737 domain-containing protein [Shimia thalassica]|uniref:DUF1737 domain-containing protein n=1 Tax=Shimia thalassica TaxID=1715693 RepID=UPI0009E703E6|nr:DUF1737 domain-containing protein [Shimia thalassica]MBU2944939.1 DUF1737 domain-containing protein [Shimia thalassica]MDO6484950.1 DUF1737 domain-containing protein [Shimia thalassica]MDO6504755.1 DUF1737 domain-containing protein [Shimia thalassica]
MTISEYKIVRTGKSEEFVDLINEAILEGWQPHGSMSIGPRPDGFLFIQPMVKIED